MVRNLSIHGRDRRRQWNALRAHLDTVLGIAAFVNTALAHQGFQPVFFVHRTGWVHVEKTGLRDGKRSDKRVFVIHIRTRLNACAARKTARQFVRNLLIPLRHARSRAEIIRPIDRNPSLDLLQRVEHAATIHHEIANNGKRTHRADPDGLFEFVDESRASLPRPVVNDHGTRAANLFKTIHFPGHRCHRIAIFVARVALNLHQAGDHVHTRTIWNDKFFGVWIGFRAVLAFNDQVHRPRCFHRFRCRAHSLVASLLTA
ncbi:signal recognition particle protein [Alicyclobacillus hesperidum URH17-3-68]|nr:signal recognition particle protein [Alicyclobacillus hesperidum URH17-3-68]